MGRQNLHINLDDMTVMDGEQQNEICGKGYEDPTAALNSLASEILAPDAAASSTELEKALVRARQQSQIEIENQASLMTRQNPDLVAFQKSWYDRYRTDE